jgi:hypothetical protein
MHLTKPNRDKITPNPQQMNISVLAMKISDLGQRKSPFARGLGWSVGDQNAAPQFFDFS